MLGLIFKLIRLTSTPARRRPPQKTGRASLPYDPKSVRAAPHTNRVLKGKCYVIDGDTIVISGTRIRLAGIDAPELEHPWGQKSKWAMVRMCKGQVVTAELHDDLSYDRLVATCYLPDGRDLAAELVKQGLALDWPKFSGGKYRAFEPDGIRKKLWRAHARQRGKLHQPA